jgi:hypothetical protein
LVGRLGRSEDSNGVEQTLTTTDTIRIIGDSIINGHTYSVTAGKIFPYASGVFGAYGVLNYVRDSLLYLFIIPKPFGSRFILISKL